MPTYTHGGGSQQRRSGPDEGRLLPRPRLLESLSDSITLLMSVVNFIEEQRGDGATSIKQLSDDHLEVANKALGMRDHRRQP